MASAYCTAAQVRQYLYGIDTSSLKKAWTGAGDYLDFFIAQFMPIAAADMDRYMRQTLNEETLQGVRLDGKGGIDLVIPNWPLKSVTACVIYYGWGSALYTFANPHHKQSRLLGLPADAPDNTADLIVDRDKGLVSINPSSLKLVSQQGNISPLWNWVFTEGTANVSVDYTHGFATPPDDVAAAQAMYTAIIIGEMAAGLSSGGASSVRIGQVQRSWGNKMYASMFDTWWGLIESILENYRVIVGEW